MLGTFWVKLWEKPQRAYNLGGLSLLLGVGIGWLGMRSDQELEARLGCLLFAAFFFAFWALLTSVGAMAMYAAVVGKALQDLAKLKSVDNG